jgi:hypothetical protein
MCSATISLTLLGLIINVLQAAGCEDAPDIEDLERMMTDLATGLTLRFDYIRLLLRFSLFMYKQ